MRRGLAYTVPYLSCILRPTGSCVPRCGEGFDAETHIPTEANSAQAGAWIPEANVEPRRPRRDQAAPRPRPAAIDGRLSDDRANGLAARPRALIRAKCAVERCLTMPADQRLRRKSDFDAVFRDGVRASGGVLALRARTRAGAEADQPCRFGYALSARLGGAVKRNRTRRRLRESARRLNAEGECRGLDVVVIGRSGALEADFRELDATLRRLLRRSVRQIDGGGAT